MEVKEKVTQRKLEEKLPNFKSPGLVYMHRISDAWKMLLSEGCFFVRESADAYWLFDLILSYQCSSALIGVTMQSWSIRRLRQGRLQIVCKDRKGEVLIGKVVKQKFVLDDLTIIVSNNHAWLKSEYVNG